jgi:phage/plasmid-associated DNA primase
MATYTTNLPKEIKELPHKYLLIGLKTITGKKKPQKMVYGNSTDNNWTYDIAKTKMKTDNKYKDCFISRAINLKGSDYFVFDVDFNIELKELYKLAPFLEDTCCVKGTTTGWHFYFKNADIAKLKFAEKIFKYGDADIITGFVFERDGGKFNHELVFECNIDEVKSVLNEKGLNWINKKKLVVKENEIIEFKHSKNDTIDDVLNNYFKLNEIWSVVETSKDNYKIICDNNMCLVDKKTQHSNKEHSCLFVSKKSLNTNCFSHEKKAESKELHKTLKTILKIEDDIECEEWTALDWAKHMKKHIYDKMRYCYGTWYICEKNIWKDVKYNSVITTQFMIDTIKTRMGTAIDITDSKIRDDVINKIKKQRKTIDTGSFASQLDKHNTTYFTDDNFEDMLFSHKEELIFRNGILNMRTKEFNKEIKREHYVLDKMIIDWDYTETRNKEDYDFVMEKFLQIHNNSEEQRKYVLKCYGYALSGCRKENLFMNFKGVRTGNGKSTISDTLNLICPNLVGVMPQMVLEKNFNKRHKYLIDTLGKRIITFEELPKDKCLDNTFIKDITGGVAYKTEVLFKTTKNINIYWTPFSNTNFTPTFNGGEDMRRRYAEVCCDNKFHSQQSFDELSEEEKQSGLNHIADNDLKNKLLGCKNEIINMLVDYYREYLRDGLAKPANVIAWSNDTIEVNNVGGDWLNDNFIITHNKEDYVSKKRVVELLEMVKNLNFKSLKDLLKAKGVNYDSKKESQKRDDRWKGAFVGIKEKPDEEINKN